MHETEFSAGGFEDIIGLRVVAGKFVVATGKANMAEVTVEVSG